MFFVVFVLWFFARGWGPGPHFFASLCFLCGIFGAVWRYDSSFSLVCLVNEGGLGVRFPFFAHIILAVWGSTPHSAPK